MKKYKEQLTLLFSVLKWISYATLTGLIVGGATAGFIYLLTNSIQKTKMLPFPSYYLLPFGLMLSLFLVKKFAPSAKGHGTEKVIEAIHKKNGKINIMVVPVKLVATIITIATGGSAGKEGPSAQIGAALTSTIADLFKINEGDRKILVICGISAGFGAVFGTPIAGALFAVEVLVVGAIMYEALLPAFIASVVSFLTAKALGTHQEAFPIINVTGSYTVMFLKTLLVSLVFSIIAYLFIELVKKVEELSEKIKINSYMKVFGAGVILVCIGLIFGENSLGLGTNVIKDTFEGHISSVLDAPLKMITTAITLAFGGSGGILTPIFYIGATAGSYFDGLFGNSQGIFAAIGLVSILAGAANTPIAASVMAVELFGTSIIPYSTLACIITFLLTGHRGVYPTQVLAFRKSRSLSLDLNVELADVKIEENSEDTFDKYASKFKKAVAKKRRKRNGK